MKKSVLKNYARLLVNCGIHVQKGDVVIVQAELDQPEFVTMCVEACYRAGAAKVMVEWSHQPLQKIKVRHESQKMLGRVEAFEEAKWQYRLDKLPCILYLLSDDPDGLKGINQGKLAKAQQARYGVIKPYRDGLNGRYRWCIAAVPGVAWAKKVFPGVRTSVAMEKLWQAILYTSRVLDADGGELDPIVEWHKHNLQFEKRCATLNGMQLRALEYKASNGTDLRVGLMPQGIFCGGGETTLGGRVEFNANIPTEEVFTSPRCGEAEGVVYASMPLSYKGEIIDNFWVRFEGGRVVDVHADQNEDLLRQMIAMDEGAAMLGECALVPYDSPIRKSGIMFYETLFDENAACHLALGEGFTHCVRNYGDYTLEQLHEMGINDSMIHVDFMIGTADMSIVGVTESGERVDIFKDGNWAI